MAKLPKKPSSVSSSTAKAGCAVTPCELSSVVVEFRPLASYQGEFGFDWLRVKEAPTDYYTEQASYIDGPDVTKGGLITGYKSSTAEYSQADIQQKMKDNEYEHFPIKRSMTTFRHLTYYVPYLNLFPQKKSDGTALTFTIPTGLTGGVFPEPPTSAELRLIIDIKGDSPERIEIEFDKACVELKIDNTSVSSPYLVPDINYVATPDNDKTSRDVWGNISLIKIPYTNINLPSSLPKQLLLEVICLKEFSTNKSIEVYAYHKKLGSTKKTPELEKKLAGKLILCANSRANRRTQKVVLVRVRTNTTGGSASTDIKTGSFTYDDINYLFKVLYQALIYPDVYPKKLDGSQDIIFDVTGDKELTTRPDKAGKLTITGKYVISTNHSVLDLRQAESVPSYLKKEFIAQKAYQMYKNYLTIFSVNVGNLVSAGGEAELDALSGKFLKNVAIYPNRKKSAMAHEMVHGLGIFHTHRDGSSDKPIKHDNKRYVFPHAQVDDIKATSNIMSYRSDGDRYSTWHWQWNIMKGNIL